MRAALPLCGPRKAVGEDQPPLRVRIQNFDRFAGKAGDDIARNHARIGDPVLADRHDDRDIDRHAVRRQRPQRCGSRRSARHIALDPRHRRSRLQAVAACIHRHALADKTEPPAAVRCAGIAQHDHRRGVCTAVANGQKSPQAKPLQRLPVIELCLNWQTIRHVLQLLRQHLGSEQIRRAVHQITRFHDRPRQLPCLLHLLAFCVRAGKAARQLRLPAARQREFFPVRAAADALCRSKKAVLPKL